MGIIVTPSEVKVKVRQYRGSMLWSFGIREAVWVVGMFLIVLSPALLPRHFDVDYYLYGLGGLSVLILLSLFWTWSPRWVATLRPSGIEYRSDWAAAFGGKWKKASWSQVETLKNTRTFERDGVVSTFGIQMDIRDPEQPTGIYSLRVSAGEFSFMDYLDALVRWVDPAKVDPDLRRMLESENRKKLDRDRKFGMGWGLAWGLIFGVTLFAARLLPREDRWEIYAGVVALSIAAGYAVRYFRKK